MKLIALMLLVLTLVLSRSVEEPAVETPDSATTPAVQNEEQQEHDPYVSESLLLFEEAVEFTGPLYQLELLYQ